MVPERPTFGWSWARHRLFRECPRRFWYRYYLAYEGCHPGAEEVARHARRLSKLTSFPLVVGQIVHDALRDLAVRVIQGDPEPDFDALWKPAWEQVVEVRNTTRDEFERNPTKHKMLDIAYYKSRSQQEIGEAMREAGDALEQCLATALDLPLWEDLRTAVTIRAPDKMVSREVHVLGDQHPCTWWGAPDLAYVRAGRHGVDVVDYKTGQSVDVEEGDAQIHGYAAFMVLCGARWTPTWRGRLIGVRDGSETEFPITEEGIHRAYSRIEADVRSWRLVQSDPARNVAPMDRFPLTTDRSRCPYCPFVELCQAMRGPDEVVGHAPSVDEGCGPKGKTTPSVGPTPQRGVAPPVRVPAIPAPRRGREQG